MEEVKRRAMLEHAMACRQVIEREERNAQICEAIGAIDGIGYAYASSYGKDWTLSLTPKYGVDARALALVVLERVRRLPTFAPEGLMKASKTFDTSSGKVTFSMPGPGGWTIKVSGADPRCEVEKYEEEVDVPEKFEPAHTETKVRYRLKDPEACGAARRE